MSKTLRQQYRSEYNALINAIHRCTSRKNAQYNDYGGRGISVSVRYTGPNGFANLLADIGPKPSPELTLDRIDNSKNYEENNLCWSDRKTQQNNRRPHKPRVTDLGWGSTTVISTGKSGKPRPHVTPLIPLGTECKSLIEWASELRISPRTLRRRFYRGLTPEQALIPGLFDTWGKPRSGPTIH